VVERRHSIIIAIAVILSIYISGCSKEEARSKPEEPKKEISLDEIDIKQKVYSFKVEGFSKDKKIQWGLEGESATIVLNKVNINNLKAVYRGDDITLTLFADKAVYDKDTQDVELKDNIIGETSDGGKFVTDYARYDAKKEEILTDSYVTVSRENIICKGKGLVTKPRLKQVVFQEEIEVDIAPDKKIFCSGPFELDHKKSMAIFNNNVKIIDKDSETFADKLTVYLNPETNQVDRIITEGNVRVVHRGDVTEMGKVSF